MVRSGAPVEKGVLVASFGQPSPGVGVQSVAGTTEARGLQGAPAAELNDLVLVGEGADCRRLRLVHKLETLNEGRVYGIAPADDPQEGMHPLQAGK